MTPFIENAIYAILTTLAIMIPWVLWVNRSVPRYDSVKGIIDEARERIEGTDAPKCNCKACQAAEDICEQILALIPQPSALDEMLAEKNAEIARLREALETIRDQDPISSVHIARAALEAEPSVPTEPVRSVGYRGAIAVPMTLILSNGQELEFDPGQFCDGGGQ